MKKYKWIAFTVTLLLSIIVSLFYFNLKIAGETTEVQADPIEVVEPIIPQVLLDIAWCESKNRQFNDDGSVHMGEINPLDTGRFQINQKYWLEKSKELGFDIFTLEGNTKMALYIYEHYGTTPWNWSKSCWSK